MTQAPLPPNAVIGILGDGQLGRMMALAAAPLGYAVHVFGPSPHSPAAQVSAFNTVAEYTDQDALARFADHVDVVTLEFENVPVTCLDFLSQHVPVHPGLKALSTAQDRLLEKTFFVEHGLEVPPFAAVKSLEDLQTAVNQIGADGVLKTARFGYDGKGQVRITPNTSLPDAWNSLGQASATYEAFVPFEREISVVLARGLDGNTAVFDCADNVHRHHILHTSTVPSTISDHVVENAQRMAEVIASGLDYVGVMAVELFVTTDHRLLVNEIAPRPHNSGHWTMDGCLHSQFSQAIRAVAGLPLGIPARHSDVIMTNLIGDDVFEAAQLAQDPDVCLHLYGKADAKPGRKMGHINRVVRPS